MTSVFPIIGLFSPCMRCHISNHLCNYYFSVLRTLQNGKLGLKEVLSKKMARDFSISLYSDECLRCVRCHISHDLVSIIFESSWDILKRGTWG